MLFLLDDQEFAAAVPVLRHPAAHARQGSRATAVPPPQVHAAQGRVAHPQPGRRVTPQHGGHADAD